MNTNTFLNKHLETLRQIQKDAFETAGIAREAYKQRIKDREAAGARLLNLKEVMDRSHSGFFSAAKSLLKMAYKRPTSVDEIGNSLLPFVTYSTALAALPDAEKDFESAEAAQNAALADLQQMVSLHDTFKGLVDKAAAQETDS